jgi:tetratricopeptide (TPR) repeat protein
MAFQSGHLQDASRWIAKAALLAPHEALYQRNLCELLRRLGRFEEAIASGLAAVKLAPADPIAHHNLALAYSDAKRDTDALDSYRMALKINPRDGASWNNLGALLEKEQDLSGAQQAYADAVALDPLHAEAQNNLGAIQAALGHLDAARESFERAVASKGDFVAAHYNLSSLKTYARDDPHVEALDALWPTRASLSSEARVRYSFAYGKALEDVGEVERAFTAYDEGNRIEHQSRPMDDARADATLARKLATFDAEFFAERRTWRGVEDSRTPIFIVGMPRSGTTLLEQILATHPAVHGAGEIGDLDEVIRSALGGSRSVASAASFDEEELRSIGSEYMGRVWARSPHSTFITDKMPGNFFHIGLIHLALPNAKIIHAMRDPMDSCFSCFARLFKETMDFAYDQATLGRYFVRYWTLMRHWHHMLPEGRILDLSYENLVANTERESRRMLEFVGLPWDPACLDFHRNKRMVSTASVAQVRKPIYTSSVARWKPFARHLAPLLEIVGSYRTPDGSATQEELPTLAASQALEVAVIRTAHTWHNEGIEHFKHRRLPEAIYCYERALELKPDFALALNSKGFLLEEEGSHVQALACFREAVRIAPELAMARLNLGMLQLKLGDWETGWDNYEARWSGSAESSQGMLSRPACPLPQWNGEANTGDLRLLVIAEQGFGDTFQFSRYLPFAAARFKRVGFACSPPTLRLLEGTFGEDVCFFTRMPVDFDEWDVHCPLLSLPRAFATRLENIPREVPYLRVGAGAQRYWKERLERLAPGGFRVGIAWAGRMAHQYDHRRSLRLDQIEVLLADSRITWVSLQKWAPHDPPAGTAHAARWLDWTDELNDFADTAALVANLDLVISIDSAMVHLAGALGRPVWMLNRFDTEWRWLTGRQDSPWYPCLRIFNQPASGDWPSVIAAVNLALAALPVPEPQALRVPLRPAHPPATAGAQPAVSVERAMDLASQHQSAGRLGDAEGLLRQILAAEPTHAHALHLLGVVGYQAGHIESAIELVARAAHLKDDVALFQSNLGEMYRQNGQLDNAIRHGRRAVELDPSLASAYSNLGIALYDAKDYEAAANCHRRAVALVPDLVQSLNNLGSIEREQKNLKVAANWYRQALLAQPDYLESLSNLGAVLVEDGSPADAVPLLERALELQPQYPEALCNLGLARLKMDSPLEAQALLLRALGLRRAYPEALVGLAMARHELDAVLEAVALLNEAIGLAPAMASAQLNLGAILAELGRSEEAEAAYRCALEVDPALADALVGLGNLRMEQGALDEGERLLAEAHALAPANVGAAFQLILARRVKQDDEILVAVKAHAAKLDSLSVSERITVHYALGKAYDDLGDYDRAFPYFLEGARLKRSRYEYDAQADATRTLAIADVVNAGFVKRLNGDKKKAAGSKRAGNSSSKPIFVLGMPRSGTTLTEQIIASHPGVYGAGELDDLLEIVQSPPAGGSSGAFPLNLTQVTRETLTAWGNLYVERLTQRAPDAQRITDKMPANYLALGLIPLILPNARIIHVQRDPLDTCLSSFMRLYNRRQPASYSLTELGRHYASYARLMAHWRALWPGRFLEVRYEDIVADLPGQARRLIAFCGLPWDDACLSFFNTQRRVRTASVLQVRQPIYSDSVQRWRHYEKFLGPLVESLGEFAPK